MLLSTMPWYTVQYSSPVPHIKFIKEGWHFENKPIDIVMMNPQGTAENKKALHFIQRRGMTTFPFTRRVQTPYVFCNSPGPHAIKEYTFLYGGEEFKQFSKKVKVVAEDPDIRNALISIKCKRTDPWNQEIKNLLPSFKNKGKWVMLTKASTWVAFGHETTILKVLEEFEEWKLKVNLPNNSFEICCKEHYDKLIQIRHDLPPISWNDEQFWYH